MYDLILKNGMIVDGKNVYEGSICIKNGKILALTGHEDGEASETIDCSGCYILPGAIDTHSHLNDPGFTESEDFYTGTRSAAAGGFTTVLEMPISIPIPSTREILNEKRELLKKKAVIDFGIWGACVPDNYKDILEMTDMGAVGFKGFITYSTHFPSINMGHIAKFMPLISECGRPLAIHCENQEINEVFYQKLQEQGRKDPAAHGESRPEFSETVAVAGMNVMAKAFPQAKIYIPHTSTAEAVQICQSTCKEGVKVFVETCTHFLTMDDSAFDEYGPFAVCNPPLRKPSSVEKLWKKVFDGEIDCLGSDHAPFLCEEKSIGADNVWKIPAGFTSIQTCLPVFFDHAVNRRDLPVTDFARLTSTNAAKIFGLYPNKGSLQIGTDADITIIDPYRKWVVHKEDLFYKQQWSPYIGWEINCKVMTSIVRGKVVYKDNAIHVKGGYGEFLRPYDTLRNEVNDDK